MRSQGIGGSLLYLVDSTSPTPIWEDVPGWREAEAENNVGLDLLDHLTHNVRRGADAGLVELLQRTLFGFEEQKYFDIKGQATGLFSQAMIAPDKAIRIPLEREPGRQEPDRGVHPRVQRRRHPAPRADHRRHLRDGREAARARRPLQDTIETYYELVDKRVPGHGEDLERLRKNRILIDGDVGEEGLLLQIFTENMFGPIFFEIIQRKGNEGFGNGNFQALFECIELDQIRRGVITVDA